MQNSIANIVRAIQPYDTLESNHISETLHWIASGATLYRLQKPDIPPQHLVSYFVMLDPLHLQILLVDHRKAGLWLPSGGHVEPDEHPHATVAREAQEELQITAQFFFPEPFFITVTQTVGQTAGHVDVSLWYVLVGDCQQSLEYDREEFAQIAWFPLQDLPFERTDPHMRRFTEKLMRALMLKPENYVQ